MKRTGVSNDGIFTKDFLRLVVYASPLSALILLVPSGSYRSWYDEGYGWPFFYGWRATDVRPSHPRVESVLAFGADIFIGFLALFVICVVFRLIYVRRQMGS